MKHCVDGFKKILGMSLAIVFILLLHEKPGSRSRTRTYDRAINSRLLYQLSYSGPVVGSITKPEMPCKWGLVGLGQRWKKYECLTMPDRRRQSCRNWPIALMVVLKIYLFSWLAQYCVV